MICASLNRPIFIVNLLRYLAEKILLLNTSNFRGDYPDFSPHFFGVGATKAGTTAVYHWLRSHPEIFLPSVKEPSCFAYVGNSAFPRI
jgi:hypothetical protein